MHCKTHHAFDLATALQVVLHRLLTGRHQFVAVHFATSFNRTSLRWADIARLIEHLGIHFLHDVVFNWTGLPAANL